MLSNLVVVALTVLGTLIFLAAGSFWVLGLIIVLLTWLGFLLISVPHKPVERRGWWTIISFFLLIAIAVSGSVFVFLQMLSVPDDIFGGIIDSMPYVDIRLLVFVIGTFLSLVLVTPLFFLVVVYVSTVYVMGLPQEEDVSFGTAFWLVWNLLLNIQRPWLLVENGEVKQIKEKGFFKTGASLGKIIVKAGNAIVLERGGKITRVEGPGAIVTTPEERLRQHFDLRPHFDIMELNNVITADQIPLKIEFGVGYRLKPATDNPSSRVISDNLGAYSVEEDTLRRATFNTTAFGWKGIAGAVGVNIRDQIMSLQLDELFDLTPDSESSSVNNRRIKKIEEDVFDTVNGFSSNSGAVITAVDIRQITVPEEIWERINREKTAKLEARIKEAETRAKELGAQIEAKVKSIEAEANSQVKVTKAKAEELAANHEAQAILKLARAKAEAEVIKGRGKAEAKAEYYRYVLEVLQTYGQSANPDTVNTVLKNVGSSITSEEEIKRFMHLLRYDERDYRRVWKDQPDYPIPDDYPET